MIDPLARLADRTDPVQHPDPEQAARIEARMQRAFANPEVVAPQEFPWVEARSDEHVSRPANRWLALVASLFLIVGGFAVWLAADRPSEGETSGATSAGIETSIPLPTSTSTPGVDSSDAAGWIRLEPGTTWRFSRIVGTAELGGSQPIGLVVDDVAPATAEGLATASARFRSDAGDPIVLGATTLVVDAGNAQLALPAAFLDPSLDLLACGSPVVAVRATAGGDVDASVWPADASEDNGGCSVAVTSVTVAPITMVTVSGLGDPVDLEAVPVMIEWRLDGTARTTTWWISPGGSPEDGLVAIDLDSDASTIDIVRSELISGG
jgi:hypothetical protein